MGLFAMKGRSNRARYILTVLVTEIIAGIIAMVASFVPALIVDESGIIAMIGLVVTVVVAIIACLVCIFQTVKRLHDLDKPGAHFWLLLVPFYNIYLSIILIFLKGTEGTNKYGPNPLTKK